MDSADPAGYCSIGDQDLIRGASSARALAFLTFVGSWDANAATPSRFGECSMREGTNTPSCPILNIALLRIARIGRSALGIAHCALGGHRAAHAVTRWWA